MVEQPSGIVTLVFTDIEESTRLLHELGQDSYREALANHRRIVREAFARHDGYEVDYEGDAFFYAFRSATGAVTAVEEARAALEDGPIRIRVGVHTGEPLLDPPKYVGVDVHRAARIMSAAHGGQVLLSHTARELVDVDVKDLGEHRLKDMSAPQRLFQLGEGVFPPLRTLHQTNLPVPPTPFIGRGRELLELGDLLSHDGVRLLTLTGPGGSGKTRLALQAAAELVGEYEHGVWWVPLASLADPRLVLEATAQALGVRQEVAVYVGDKRMLLLLDNFEQVLEAGPDVHGLLAMCPNMRLLVTSRGPLHLSGEQVYPVPPLVDAEAVGFFLARARAVEPGFQPSEAVTEICRRLDNLPLALELAAARVTALSAQRILDRLEQRLPLLTGGARDAPQRQRTLRATIEWSYGLLDETEQRLFARLGVFAGGWTLEAAEEVCDADLDTVQSLVEKSLVRREGERYLMLETIREYAVERLGESGEADQLRRRHLGSFLALGVEAAPALHAWEGPEWFDRLEAEHANLRAALEWALRREDADLALRLIGSIWSFWLTRGYWTEGRGWVEAALALEGEGDPGLRIDPLWGAAVLSIWLGDLAAGRQAAEQMLALAREIDSKRGEAIALCNLGIAAHHEGDHAAARELLQRSIQLARTVGDEWLLSVAINNLGDVLLEEEEFTEAIAHFEESLRIGTARGDLDRATRGLNNLGFAALGLGELARARSFFRRGLEAAQTLRNRDGLVYGFLGLAAALAPRDPSRAAHLLGQSHLLLEESGAKSYSGYELRVHDQIVPALQTSLGGNAYAHAHTQGRAMPLDKALEYALTDDP